MDGLPNGKSFDAARSNEAEGESGPATFAYRIILNMNGLRGNEHETRSPVWEHPGAFNDCRKNLREMGSKKGNVKERRNVRCPQVIEKIGSSGWIRTSNPPVNRRKKKR
jgi:hypothetical protein